MTRIVTVVAAAMLLLFSQAALSIPGRFPQMVPEIPDVTLKDFAEVKMLQGMGPVIVYNPIICAQAGRELCEFSRWHEYGHIVLGHPLRGLRPERMESEADRWAAQNAPADVVRAAYRFFMAGNGASPVHGESRERAARLARYLRV